ncbi:carbon-nitrogen hydrolase family protein [Oceaniglobus trochenteri]|uniref:carbon-nitrogen hydrolase family protein n=1 Tax=Oceaniglobus trochenteri TaxID=2763260 RepID=UPI001CFFE83F|nr:carbon-nitrogen hydrolase family protein [Oceaniglobus trochenteri]
MAADVLKLCMAQMTSADSHGPNIAFLRDAAARAADAGCHMLALPEVAGLCNRNAEKARAQVVAAKDDPFIAAACEAAARQGLWINTGSTPVAGPEGKFLNHGSLIDSQGEIVADYDKIHMFDVHLDGQDRIGESDTYAGGTRAVLTDTPWGRVGLSICYDLRFPALFRGLAQRGAGILFIPAAFTVPTGQAHWHVLLRARAIETGSFVVAPAQVGKHDDGRRTYGHSLVVSPWGEVICDMGGEDPGLAMVELELEQIARARRQIPSLTLERSFDFVTPADD